VHFSPLWDNLHMPHSLLNKIMNIAEEHDGLVPCVAAKEAGISASALVKMAQRGRLQRIARGVYRIPFFPASSSQFSDYHEAIAWARSGHGPTAVISHESALALYGISDALPKKLHIIVPKNTRFQRRTIPERIAVHYANLATQETTTHEGVPVTTIERTIEDVIDRGQTDFAAQAIRDARQQIHIDKNTAARLTNYLKQHRKKNA
jgi:predicted transcriptional regulator of viral defense system